MNPSVIEELISDFDTSEIEEITIESNPIAIIPRYIELLSKTKVNRISIGVQSMIDKELNLLGRLHNADMMKEKTSILSKYGFKNYSFDLIYGLPFQKLSDVEYSLNKMLELKPKHISIYCLSLEKDVPLYKLHHKIPEDETVSQMYYLIRKILIKSGFNQYEISNFAKPGYESKHNLSYWTDKNYLGLGASAAGYINQIRYENPADISEYYKQIDTKSILPQAQKISPTAHAEEFLFLGLRLSNGIDLSLFEQKFGRSAMKIYLKKLEKYVKMGLIIKKGRRLFLSPQAYFISNEIFTDILL